MSKVMATCFALAAFAVAIIAGISSGNPAAQVLSRALIAMLICYPVGLVAGLICERVIAEHVREYAEKHPIPESPEAHQETGEQTNARTEEKEVTVA